jgi:hypothetical protein
MKNELEQIYSKEKQIALLTGESKFVKLIRPAIIGDGILKLLPKQIKYYQDFYQEIFGKFSFTKFVPASGAATRMFGFLIESYMKEEITKETIDFLRNAHKLPFYEEWQDMILEKEKVTFQDLLNQNKVKTILKYLLFDEGLNYANKPKLLIPFHVFNNEKQLPIDTHCKEAGLLFGEQYHVHFTVSEFFENDLKNFVYKYQYSYSFQDKRTNNIVVDQNNKQVFDENEQPVTLPAGHGALLSNLSKIESDYIYIKNVDNISIVNLSETDINNKKALLGLLIDTHQSIINYLHLLENKVDEKMLKEIMCFLKERFQVNLSNDEILNAETLKILLNKPFRVCGMVINKGEKGGGPFWTNNNPFPQIVEKIQINTENQQQLEILNQSTHFNPVEIYCTIKDYKKHPFNLTDFIDKDTYMISYKLKDGKNIKILELPGLWNGSMSNWLTLFVEIPIETFNPVKSVSDLLKPNHQINHL